MKSANPSIAQSRPSVNSQISITEQDRVDARKLVRGDTTLSLGAKLFYMALDDWATDAGFTEMKRSEMAAGLVTSTQSITTWTAELDGKYIRQERGRHGSKLVLLCKMPRSQESCLLDSRSQETLLLTAPEVKKADFSFDRSRACPPALLRNVDGKEGGWVGVPPPKKPPARSFPRLEALGSGLRGIGFQPDRKLLEILLGHVPEECPIEAALSAVRHRVNRPHSKPLQQCMLIRFFSEDVPVKWEVEAKWLEDQRKIELEALPRPVDEAADRKQAREILARGDADRIEIEWAHMVLEPGGWAATA